jgi:hypothetical protein
MKALPYYGIGDRNIPAYAWRELKGVMSLEIRDIIFLTFFTPRLYGERYFISFRDDHTKIYVSLSSI